MMQEKILSVIFIGNLYTLNLTYSIFCNKMNTKEF